jgi:Icc protein
MLIGQITDIHIGFDREDPSEANLLRLEKVLGHMASLTTRPDLLLLTGDLTEHGDADSNARLVEALKALPVPAWPIPGNHDLRDTLLAAFPAVTPMAGGFVQYAVDLGGLRLVMLDTLEVGRHGGAFCPARAAWLADELARHPDQPTLIAMHHPPFATGIPWMDAEAGEPWVNRFADAIAGHDQIVMIATGHVHRPSFTQWRGKPAMVCPSSAPMVGLDFRPISGEAPDGRALITDDVPAYALHRWDGAQMVSHVIHAEQAKVLASYGPALQPMIAGMLAERRAPQ